MVFLLYFCGMKVTKDNLFEYLRSVIKGVIPDSKYIRVLLPEVEYKDIRFALDAMPPMGESLHDDGRMIIVYRGVRIDFVCDYLTDDEELTYVLLENEMLRGEVDYYKGAFDWRTNRYLKKIEEKNELEERIGLCNKEIRKWIDKYFDNNNILVEKLHRIPKFIRKIFGAI